MPESNSIQTNVSVIVFFQKFFRRNNLLIQLIFDRISAPPDPGFHQPNYSDIDDDLCMDWDEYDRQLAQTESSLQVDSCPFIEWEAVQSGSNDDDDNYISSEDMRHDSPAPRNNERVLVCYSESSDEESLILK